MPSLKNTRHERFAQELMRGSSATDAYERAGYRRDDGHASRLAGDGRVVDRVAELQRETAARFALERDDIIQMLLDDHALARQRGQAAAAIRAVELLGRELFGMFVDKAEIGGPGDFSRLSDKELRDNCLRTLELPAIQAFISDVKRNGHDSQ